MRGLEVRYEVCIRNSKAALYRLGRVIVDYHVQVRDSYLLGETVVLMLKLDPGQAEVVKTALAPWTWEYRSPTDFNHGSLLPRYRTAEEEVTDMEKSLNVDAGTT